MRKLRRFWKKRSNLSFLMIPIVIRYVSNFSRLLAHAQFMRINTEIHIAHVLGSNHSDNKALPTAPFLKAHRVHSISEVDITPRTSRGTQRFTWRFLLQSISGEQPCLQEDPEVLNAPTFSLSTQRIVRHVPSAEAYPSALNCVTV